MTLLELHALVARILHNATLAALTSGEPLTHALVITTAEHHLRNPAYSILDCCDAFAAIGKLYPPHERSDK